MAPEVLEKKPYNERIDIYSFALILWELLTRQTPYSGIHSMEQLIETVVTKEIRPDIPEGTLPNLAGLIKKCWSTDPAKRIPFADIVKANVFDLITLSTLLNLGPHEDKEGINLWKSYFYTKDGLKCEVSFDHFAKAFCNQGKLTFNPEDQKFKCLKAVLVKHNDIVTLEEYGFLLQRFGPLDNYEHFLDRIVKLLKQTWFHGDSPDSEKLIQNSPNGTFLVRFSSEPGSYIICVKNNQGELKRYKIMHRAGTDYVIGKASFPTIEDIIIKEAVPLFLKAAAPDSPFEGIFNTEKQKQKEKMSVGYKTLNTDIN